MRHQVLAPSYTDALMLVSAIESAGHFARLVQRNQYVGVIVDAPLDVLTNACHSVGFIPGRTLAP